MVREPGARSSPRTAGVPEETFDRRSFERPFSAFGNKRDGSDRIDESTRCGRSAGGARWILTEGDEIFSSNGTRGARVPRTRGRLLSRLGQHRRRSHECEETLRAGQQRDDDDDDRALVVVILVAVLVEVVEDSSRDARLRLSAGELRERCAGRGQVAPRKVGKPEKSEVAEGESAGSGGGERRHRGRRPKTRRAEGRRSDRRRGLSAEQ